MDGNSETWFSEIMGLLARVDVNVKDNRGRTALHIAAETGCTESAALLIQHNADVDLKDQNGRTALHVASVSTRVKIVDMLKNHANMKIPDKLGYTAVHLAVQAGSTEIVEKLSEALGEQPLGITNIYRTGPPRVFPM